MNNISSITDKQVIEFIQFISLIVDRITYLKGMFDRATFGSLGKYIKKLEVFDIESEYYYHKSALIKQVDAIPDSSRNKYATTNYIGSQGDLEERKISKKISEENSIENDLDREEKNLMKREFNNLSNKMKSYARFDNEFSIKQQIGEEVLTMGYSELWELSLANIDIYLSQNDRYHSELGSLADAMLRFSRILPDDENSSINFTISDLIRKFVLFLSNN
jgi:hypothetical protein